MVIIMEFSVELPYETLFDDKELYKAAEQGIRYISAPFELIESEPKKVIKERAAAIASAGIKVDTSHPRFGQYNSQNSLVNQYALQRKQYLEQLKDGIDRMSLLGVRVTTLHTGGSCLPAAPDWAWELCAESVRELEEAAKDSGIVIVIENTFYRMPQCWDGAYAASDAANNAMPAQSSNVVYDDINKICKLIDGIDSPNVKSCFDAGHAHYLGDLAADHEMMGKRIHLYHLHDNARNNDMHLAPGYGTLNWEALGKLIANNKTASPAYIEASPWMLGSHALMIRQTKALVNGGRQGEDRRCMKCGHMILTDDKGQFCGCGSC